MKTTLSRRFSPPAILYAEDFDQPYSPDRQSRETALLEDTRERETLHEAQLTDARQQGFDTGWAAAVRAATEDHQLRVDQSLEKVGTILAALQGDLAEAFEKVSRDALALTASVLATALPILMATYGDRELLSAGLALVGHIDHRARLEITAGKSVVAAVAAAFGADDGRLTYKAASEGADAIAIRWEDGYFMRETHKILHVIEKILSDIVNAGSSGGSK